jgi:serpin B
MKFSHLISIGLATTCIIGCSNKNGNPVTNEPTPQPFSVAKSASVTRDTSSISNEYVATQAESNNKFAIAMYNQLKKDGKNLFISPYSITEALAMTAAGANGTTKQQIRDALQVSLDGVHFDEALNAIDQSVMKYASATQGITLNVANSSWMQTGWEFKVSYLDNISKYYGAGINLLDFITKPEESRIIINTWIADQTNDKITNLIPPGSITSNTRLVLGNAIYFLGEWLYTFNPDFTSTKSFTLLDKSTVQAPTMSLNKPDSMVKMRYTHSHGARALDFPYKGDRIVMTVILPDVDSFATVENSLSATMISQLVSGLKEEKLMVSLPKFKFTYGAASLTDAFKALGMTDAFNPNLADFSGIDGSKSLYVADVLHKAFISVDEKGTEAAAATVVLIGITSADAPVIFVVDRPFIFVIRDKVTGTILFIGRILNPTLTE